jgi:anti-sigma B factor antagonist
MSSTPQAFAVEVGTPDDAGVVVRVTGELDMSTAPELTSSLTSASAGVEGAVTLDLTGVTFLDSSAIGALIAVGQELADRGRSLRIGPRSTVVSRVLEITGLSDSSDAFHVLPEQA